jgi:hypothetical protein
MMATYADQDRATTPELAIDRRRLVEQFNRAVGPPAPNEVTFQEAFVADKVTYDEAVSYVRFAEHMIAAVDLSVF